MKKDTKRNGIYLLIGGALLLVFFYFQNNSLVVSEYTVTTETLPQNFDGYNIVHLSDLHNKSFGENQSELVNRVEEMEPDSIVFTGDLVDSNRYEEEPSLILMEKLVAIAPVYYVTGNHEWESGRFETFEEKLKNTGVQVMRNTTEEISIGRDEIQITGIDDAASAGESYSISTNTREYIDHSIQEAGSEENFSLLLAHRPEIVSLYKEYGFDVVFSGHAHGGQFRLPFVGGLFAPGQGLFPEYTSGTHEQGGTTMVVSRGLGNSVIPVRIFNRPEIIAVTLKRGE